MPLLVSSDGTGLKRCLFNLIQNAQRYGGKVRVVLRSEQQQAVIMVEDDGPGIPAAELRHVMRPFHRGETSRNRASGGIGFGARHHQPHRAVAGRPARAREPQRRGLARHHPPAAGGLRVRRILEHP